MINNRICILGTGAWATALGVSLSKNNNTIFMWGINQKEINDINSGYNKQYFGDKKFASSLSATNDMKVAIGNSKYILLAVPSSALKDVLEKLKLNISKQSNLIIINVIKGLDDNTQDVISKSIKKTLKGYKAKLVTICGPSYAEEVFNEFPTIVNASSSNLKITKQVCDLFDSKYLKVIPIKDEIGLQIFSAIKNLLAIGIGIAYEHFKSTNATSALLTIGINEIKTIAIKMGADKKTILDFCGVGDIFLTCSSPQSRNFSFGKEIYQKGVTQAVNLNKKTVEGYQVYKVVEKIIATHDLNTPLFSSIINVLNEKIKPENLISTVWDLVYKKHIYNN